MKSRRKKLRSVNRLVIGVIGVRHGVGCTHVACSIANYLRSVEKRTVLLIEMDEVSQLLPIMMDEPVSYAGHVVYSYQGVWYALSAGSREAEELIWQREPGAIVIDFGVYRNENALVLDQCKKKIVLGRLMPWCRDAYDSFMEEINKNKKDMTQMEYYSFMLQKQQQDEFVRRYPVLMRELPVLSNPFAMEKRDFACLQRIIYQ